MHVTKFFYRLQLNDYVIEADKVWLKNGCKFPSIIYDVQIWLSLRRNVPICQFYLQGILVNLFRKAAPKIAMNRHGRTNYIVHFILI